MLDTEFTRSQLSMAVAKSSTMMMSNTDTSRLKDNSGSFLFDNCADHFASESFHCSETSG